MSSGFVYSTQVITKRVVLEGSATGTPTVQQYINGVASGSPINGSGSGAVWVFAATVPAATVGDYYQLTMSATVSGVSIVRDIVSGAVVEVTDESLIVDIEQDIDTVTNLLKGGRVTQVAPVTATGEIVGPIVIGDDYKAASGRSFIWYFEPASFAVGAASCFFGGRAQTGSSWLVQGAVTAVTIDGEPKWKLEFELDQDVTELLQARVYNWSVELRGPSPAFESITQVRGVVRVVAAYTQA
jgi:hypothetical protein